MTGQDRHITQERAWYLEGAGILALNIGAWSYFFFDHLGWLAAVGAAWALFWYAYRRRHMSPAV